MSVECTYTTLVSISSSPSPLCLNLFYKCASICSRFRILPLNRQAQITHQRHTLEGRSRLSVECTHPTLESLSSSPSPLSAKLCSMIVHRSDQELELYCILSWLQPISDTRDIIGRAVVGCPPNAHPQIWYLSAPFHHLCLLNFVPSVCIDPFKISYFTA